MKYVKGLNEPEWFSKRTRMVQAPWLDDVRPGRLTF
jgi:hypothetical protein